ncbi:MAG: OmpA family protein, partial [Myxococcota bacterium]
PRIAIKANERAEPAEGAALACPAELTATPREPPPASDPATTTPDAGMAPDSADSGGAASMPAAGSDTAATGSAGVAADSSSTSAAASGTATAAEPIREGANIPAEDGPVEGAASGSQPATDGATGSGPATAAAQLPAEFQAYSGVVKVAFRRNKSEMRSSSKKTLRAVIKLLKANPNVRLEIAAHTDSRKGADKSRTITQEQADAVVAYLVRRGIDKTRLSAVGHGMDRPLADNGSSKGRKQNRRIEFSFSAE